MTLEIGIFLVLLAAVVLALVLELAPPDLVAMSGFAAVVLIPLPRTGGGWAPLLDWDRALGVFSNPAVLTVGALFLLAAGMEKTGATDWLGAKVSALGGRGEAATLLTLLVPATLISAFINDTPVVLLFVPIALKLADERGISPSRMLIPLSYAALLGGKCTLIGTSTNILVHSMAETRGLPGITMFELAWVGVPVALTGLAVMILFRRLLPERESLAALIRDVQPREYLLEVVVAEGSTYVGKAIGDLPFAGRPEVHVLEVVREGEEVQEALDAVQLRERDRLLLIGPADLANEVRADGGLRFPFGVETPEERTAILFEGVVAPGSRFINRTVRELRFRQRFAVAILAVHRAGRSLRQDIPDIRFRFGDTVLMMGSQASLDRLRDEPDFRLVAAVDAPAPRRGRAVVALLLGAAVVTLAALEVAPISILAIGAGILLVATRCLRPEEAYEAIHWNLLFLIFGMLALGEAMEATGTARFLAESVIGPAIPYGPHAVLGAVLFLTILLTSFLTNNAAVVLMVPVALSAVAALEAASGAPVNPHPFLIAVAIAGSASFVTPVGYQTNTYVFGIGGYRFSDFARLGVPLAILVWLAGFLLIPRFWPF